MLPHARERQEAEAMMAAVRRLGSRVLGIVCGLLCGFILFAATAFLVIKGGPVVGPHLSLLGQFFPGYSVTWPGAFLGFFYGFVCGFLGGWLVGWVYNTIVLFKSRN